MRILLLTPLLLLGACNVTKDPGNDQVTVQYNQDTAENAAEDVGNTAKDIGNAISNEADETAAKVNNSAIVAGDNDKADNKVENKQ